jgi:hypothetical protein
MKWLVVVIAVLSIAAQEPEHRDDKYKEDPHARCMRPEVVELYGPANGSLHACSCHQICHNPGTEEQWVQEDSACAMYCSAQRCGCHPDSNPCEGPHVEEAPGR